jgi:hypothetical protein
VRPGAADTRAIRLYHPATVLDLSYVFDARRWRTRFRSERSVAAEATAAGRTPDASVDEVGTPGPPRGFAGNAMPDKVSNGYGTGTVIGLHNGGAGYYRGEGGV